MKRIALLLLLIGAVAYGAIAIYHDHLRQIDSIAAVRHEILPDGFESFVELSNSIQKLHEKKKPVQPGDWLDAHPEGGQSFAQYVMARATKPLKDEFSTIYVLPLGDFDEIQRRIVDQTSEFLGHYFGMKVQLLDAKPLGEIPETARRMRNDTEQVLTPWILKERLLPDRPDDAVAVIGLVTCDLWPGDLGFVFGSASLVDRVGVWSLYRNGDPRESEAAYRLCLKRTLKTAVHETGHMLGIPHCAEYECCMNGSNGRAESDQRVFEFCPECQPKIWWTCGADATARSRNLADFAKRHSMPDEASFWNKQANALVR